MGGGQNKVRELEQPCIAPPTYVTGPMFFLAKISDEFKSSVAALLQTVNLTAGINQATVSGASAQIECCSMERNCRVSDSAAPPLWWCTLLIRLSTIMGLKELKSSYCSNPRLFYCWAIKD